MRCLCSGGFANGLSGHTTINDAMGLVTRHYFVVGVFRDKLSPVSVVWCPGRLGVKGLGASCSVELLV